MVQCYSLLLMVLVHFCALCDSSGQFRRTISIGFFLIRRTTSVNDIVIRKTNMPITCIVCLRAADIHKNLIFHRYLFKWMREITKMSEI